MLLDREKRLAKSLGGSTGALTDGGARPNHFDGLEIGNANTGEPGFRASLFSNTWQKGRFSFRIPLRPSPFDLQER
jgi:hypothetical protein